MLLRRQVIIAAVLAVSLLVVDGTHGAVTLGNVPCATTQPNSVSACYQLTDVPLNYADASGTKITLYMTLFSPSGLQSPPKNIIWYLNFGCDAWSPDDSAWMAETGNALQAWIAVPNFRGDGLSTPRLTCKDEEDNGMSDPPSVECAKQLNGADLRHYTLDNGAQDMNQFVAAWNAQQKGTAFHYIASTGYGSVWAQRTIAMYPTLFRRSVLASYTNPMAFDFFAAFAGRDAVVREVMTICHDDALCSAQLGGGQDPNAVLSRAMWLAKRDLLPCIDPLRSSVVAPTGNHTWDEVFGEMLLQMAAPLSRIEHTMKNDRQTPTLVPALLYRLRRCLVADSYVLGNATRTVNAKNRSPAPRKPVANQCNPSTVLLSNILLNELVRENPEESLNFVQQVSVLSGTTGLPYYYTTAWLYFYQAFPLWRQPSENANDVAKWFPRDANGAPVATAGTVKLTGRLDASRPMSFASTSVLWEPSSSTNYYGVLPTADSFPFTSGPTPCIVEVVRAYLQNASTQGDLPSCLHTPNPPLDLLGTAFDTQQVRTTYLGTTDSWNFTLPTARSYILPDLQLTPVPTMAGPHTAPPPLGTTPAPNGDNHHHTVTHPSTTHTSGNHTDSKSSSHTVAIIAVVCTVFVVGLIIGVVLLVRARRNRDRPAQFRAATGAAAAPAYSTLAANGGGGNALYNDTCDASSGYAESLNSHQSQQYQTYDQHQHVQQQQYHGGGGGYVQQQYYQ